MRMHCQVEIERRLGRAQPNGVHRVFDDCSDGNRLSTSMVILPPEMRARSNVRFHIIPDSWVPAGGADISAVEFVS